MAVAAAVVVFLKRREAKEEEEEQWEAWEAWEAWQAWEEWEVAEEVREEEDHPSARFPASASAVVSAATSGAA